MNKQTLIWSLIVAVPVGVAALATGYVYRDTGHLPFQEPAETVSATANGAGTVTEPSAADAGDTTAGDETEVAAAEGQAPDAAAEDAAPLKGPSFDVVGVEPTGETVVAGRSDAGAIVALTANGEVVGKSIANNAGEWTIILDAPLKPGDYAVGLEVHDEKGDSVETSEQNLIVSVPEGGKERPLVVLNTPDGPADILQKPDRKPKETQTAAVSGQGPEDQAPENQAPENQATDISGTAKSATAADETGGTIADASSGAAQKPDGDQETDVAAASAGAADGTSADQKPMETAALLQESPQAVSEGTAKPDDGSQSAPESASANGQTTPDPELKTPEALERADQPSVLESGSETETAAAVAPAADAAQAGGTTGSATSVAGNGQGGDIPATPAGQEPKVTVEAVESEKDKVYVAGTGEPGKSVRVYVGDEFQGEAKVNSSGKWLVQGTGNVAEGNVEVRADVVAEDGNTVDARAAVTFEKEQDQQIVLTKVVAKGTGGSAGGQGAEVQKSLPVVIIRKGDNLWRISQRLYGEGVRYTTIYQANQDQIRNPDLIYPGQVFLTPEGDLNWQPAANGAQPGAGSNG